MVPSLWLVFLIISRINAESRGSMFSIGGGGSGGSPRTTRTLLANKNPSAFVPTGCYPDRRQMTCHRHIHHHVHHIHHNDNLYHRSYRIRQRQPLERIIPSIDGRSSSACASRTTSNSNTQLSLSILPSLPLISSTDNWGNIAILCTTASVSQSLGKTTAIGRLLGPPVTAMAIAFVLGSIGILPPGGSQGAKTLQLLSIQLATPLLLLSVSLPKCRKRCGPLFLAFALAAIGTITASTLAVHLCAGPLVNALGVDGLKVAAALMAKNVGGGVNYVAVCRSLGVGGNAIAAGLCVDNVFALVYFPVVSAIAAGRPDVTQDDDEDDTDNDSTTNDETTSKSITIESISKSLALATIATYLGEKIGGPSAALPLSTALTLLYTTIYPNTANTSLGPTGNALGTALLYLFFATAGAPGLSIADSVRASFVPIGCFLAILYAVHGGVMMMGRIGVLWWVRRIRSRTRAKRQGDDDSSTNTKTSTGSRGEEEKEEEGLEGAWAEAVVNPQRLLCASSASIGGPATAAALAQANGWKSLVGPSLVVGNLGYAIATFAGIAFHSFAAKFYL